MRGFFSFLLVMPVIVFILYVGALNLQVQEAHLSSQLGMFKAYRRLSIDESIQGSLRDVLSFYSGLPVSCSEKLDLASKRIAGGFAPGSGESWVSYLQRLHGSEGLEVEFFAVSELTGVEVPLDFKIVIPFDPPKEVNAAMLVLTCTIDGKLMISENLIYPSDVVKIASSIKYKVRDKSTGEEWAGVIGQGFGSRG